MLPDVEEDGVACYASVSGRVCFWALIVGPVVLGALLAVLL